MDLEPSALGTKRHWDDVYTNELSNFEEIGDEGEVWFGEDSVRKMVRWCLKHVPSSPSHKVLEVGCGNGALLLALAEEGYDPDTLEGLDYSENAVALAQKVAHGRDPAFSAIKFFARDFLVVDVEEAMYNLVLDKGTLDAIALAERNSNGTPPFASYPRKVAEHLKPRGFFLITSCNFTEEELISLFTAEAVGLEYHSRIEHKAFSFGGKSGSTTSCVAFQKRV